MPRATLDTDIPGLTVTWTTVSASLYPNIVHVKSGKYVKRFNHEPIKGGKKRFIKFVNDSGLKNFNWNLTEKQMLKTADERGRIIMALRYGEDSKHNC